MKSLVATFLVVLSVPAFHASSKPLPASVRAEMISAKEWHPGCPVPFSGLRVLTLSYWGFDGKRHTGRLIVNAKVVTPVTAVFKQLYKMRFPIHHMALSDAYGPASGRPDGRRHHGVDGVPPGGAVTVLEGNRHGELVDARLR